MKQLQSLLRSRPPESELEIEFEMTWRSSRVDLDLVWTRVSQLNVKEYYLTSSFSNILLLSIQSKSFHSVTTSEATEIKSINPSCKEIQEC